MSEPKPENTPAFPTKPFDVREGMTLRDYFAAKIAAAMVSTIHDEDDYTRAVELAKLNGFDTVSQWFARESYKQADAMLKERQR